MFYNGLNIFMPTEVVDASISQPFSARLLVSKDPFVDPLYLVWPLWMYFT